MVTRKVAGSLAPGRRPQAESPNPPPSSRADSPRVTSATRDAGSGQAVEESPPGPRSRLGTHRRTHRAGARGEEPARSVTGPAMLLTAEQAGALLTVPGSWLRDKAATRKIPCRRLGKHLRFALADLTTITEMAARPADPHRPAEDLDDVLDEDLDEAGG